MVAVAAGVTAAWEAWQRAENEDAPTDAGVPHPAEVAMVAHDLRTPLNAIVLSASTLQRRWESGRTEDPTPLLGGIFREAERMMRLIDDLVASRTGAAGMQGNLETAAPASLVQDTIDQMEPLAQRRGVALRASCPPGLPHVRVDRHRLGQVFTNLIENALRFSPPGSEVTVAATAEEDGVAFRVADAGRGIPEDELPQVFNPFFRGRRANGGGMGLGLYIARTIVEGHGGRVHVESTPGAGATFTFVVGSPGTELEFAL